MMSPADTDRLVDWGLNRLNLTVLLVGFLAILFEGFDNFAMSYAAPHILKEWGLVNKAILGPIFSSSIVGVFIGAPACGYIADKVGPRWIVILCCALIGVPTIMIAAASSLRDLVILRFIAGIGFGGIAPCLISLTTEYAPTRYRATMVTIMYAGITVGAAAAGAAGTWLVPVYGWRSMFLLGGVGILVVAVIAVLVLPESLSHLLAKRRVPMSLQKYVKPSLVSHLERDDRRDNSALRAIFKGRLAHISIMTWLVNFSVLMGYQAIASWLPTLLSTVERPPASAASFLMLFLIGGTLGGVFLSRLIDRGYIAAMAWAFIVSIPMVALIPITADNDVLLYMTVFSAGCSVMSIQFSINAVCSMAYPPSVRSFALGMLFATGRIGSISGPLLISLGLVLGMMPVQTFIIACLPFAVGAVASFILAKLWKNQQPNTVRDVNTAQVAGPL